MAQADDSRPIDRRRAELARAAQATERYDAARAVRGRFRDEIYRRGLDGQEVLVAATPLRENLIVGTLPVLLAGLMANEHTFAGGILFHAIGEGLAEWDTGAVGKPDFAQTRLVAEHHRKAPDSITYLDDAGQPVDPVTPTLLVKTTFDYDDAGANGRFIREQGLFGGTATEAKDSGLMVDAINHPAIWKDETIRLVRFIQLMF
ncbi:MAG: hypothetical protein IT345_08720 [Trueperaceae bacterium]|nr:hypothetical protein [Trueperaceae bacterium]